MVRDAGYFVTDRVWAVRAPFQRPMNITRHRRMWHPGSERQHRTSFRLSRIMAGSAIATTASCIASIPRLKPNRLTSRHQPVPPSVFNADAKARPAISPNEAAMLSSCPGNRTHGGDRRQRIETAIRISTGRVGNLKSPSAESFCVLRCSIPNAGF